MSTCDISAQLMHRQKAVIGGGYVYLDPKNPRTFIPESTEKVIVMTGAEVEALILATAVNAILGAWEGHPHRSVMSLAEPVCREMSDRVQKALAK